ncbi:MAG: DUF6879 family protein [Pseudonocardiaceae bacterium]
MQLRKLAKDKDSDIGGCQTVYGVIDATAHPECIVQGPIVSNSHLEDVLPGEGGVRIKREVLIDAVRQLQEEVDRTAELILPGSEAFGALFHSFAHSVFRLETLQSYRSARDRDLLNRFVAGEPKPPDPAKARWTSMIASNVQSGKTVQRVHVVREPLTDYLRFELTWGYEPNVAVGEDVRIIAIGQNSWPADLPQHDFWLFDSAELYDMHYDDDQVWLGAGHVTDPKRIVDACRWRDAALHYGTPWSVYVHTKPELAHHLSVSQAP